MKEDMLAILSGERRVTIGVTREEDRVERCEGNERGERRYKKVDQFERCICVRDIALHFIISVIISH